MKFDTNGTTAWQTATGRSIHKKLALIINNKLVYTPIVNAQINAGISELNRGNYSKAELEVFEKQIKAEM